MELEEIITSTEMIAKEAERKEKEEEEKLRANKMDTRVRDEKSGDKSATPNLNAWLKAFGAPKKPKKTEEEEARKEEKFTEEISNVNNPTSPAQTVGFILPAPRTTRKASTGSTISERSSFSQDPDSPRIGIDERVGAPYPSPIGASPIMASPRDDIQKASSPYPINGAIKVGFYQDTTTKSSPEKSCSPREQSSPYSNYAQHLYTSAGSTIAPTYGSGAYNSQLDQPATLIPLAPLGFNNKNKTPSYYEQYKQPRSQESDYNSSMSPNPNSPYQNQQQSPYQSQNSPYHQSQNSPYQQSAPQTPAQITPISPSSSYPTPTSPYQQQLSPYEQPNSPHSNYHQTQQQKVQTQQLSPQQSTAPSTQQVAATQANQEGSSPFHVKSNSPYSQPDPHSPYNQAKQPPTQLEQQTSPQSRDQQPQQSATPLAMSHSEWSRGLNTNMAHLQQIHPLSADESKGMSLHSPGLPRAPMHSYMNYSNQYQANIDRRLDDALQSKLPSQYSNSSDNSMSLMGETNRPLQLSVSNITASDGSQRELLNLDYNNPNISKHIVNKPLNKSSPQIDHSKISDPPSSISILGPISYNIGLNYDIPSSKAIEMFNRAATMGFPKTFSPSPSLADNKIESSAILTEIHNHSNSSKSSVSLISMGYHGQDAVNRPLSHSSYGQTPTSQSHQHPEQERMATIHHIPQTQHLSPYSDNTTTQSKHPSSDQSRACDLNVPIIHQRYDLSRQSNPNLEIHNYRSSPFHPTGPPSMDPVLRNMSGLPMMEDNLISLQTPGSSYYQKDIPPAHMYGKNMPQPSTVATLQRLGVSYSANRDIQSSLPTYQRQPPQQQVLQSLSQPMNNSSNSPVVHPLTATNLTETKPKRTRRKKNVVPEPTANQIIQHAPQHQSQTQPQQQQQIHHQQPHQPAHQQQGFQSYAGLKTSIPSGHKVSSAAECTAISLKTATASMVPGSAFNFGPTPTGLGLSAGIYTENPSYLDEYRSTPTPYFIPQSHRSTPDPNSDKSASASAATAPPPPPPSAASTYHQFLAHPSSHSTYPFMNPSLDTNSQLYQQYLRQELRQAHMIMNPGLLGHGAAAGYPQPGYHPALSMHKPYDTMNTMNRPPWFQ